MIHSDQMKGFIPHPEQTISNTALAYFAESYLYDNDTALMPLLLEKLKQPKQDRPLHLFHGYRFPQTEETVRELLALLQSPSIDPNTRVQLAIILRNSDLRLLTPYEEFIAQDPLLATRVQQRRDLANMDDQELKDAFRQFIEQTTGKYVNEFDTTYGDELVLELSRRSCIDPEAVLQKLGAYHPNNQSYETDYFAQLAGAMKLEAAIPILIGFLGEDNDWLPARAVDALVHIGTSSVITTLTDRYLADGREYFRLFATDVFGRIKLPASEEALLTLLPKEQNLTYATKLADGLCRLGSTKGLPLVEAMVEGGYDHSYLSLTESIYCCCVISGTPHPSLSVWKRELDEEEARLAKREAELNGMAGFAGFLGKSQPHTNPNKVGRNDPCPCGSGKKHKKCCGA